MSSGLRVTSPAFEEGGWIPVEHSPLGADRSPELRLEGLDARAVSLVITFDDASHPLFPNYNHWVIWNVPATAVVPAAVPAGERVASLGGAVQGRAYGRHRYKGPKPPLNAVHAYTLTVYAVDRLIDVPPSGRRADVLRAIDGHVLQTATLSGRFRKGCA